MTSFAPIPGLIGGILIGLSAVILMLTIGRTAGISGIVVNAMTATGAMDRSWRLAFIVGLPLGALRSCGPRICMNSSIGGTGGSRLMPCTGSKARQIGPADFSPLPAATMLFAGAFAETMLVAAVAVAPAESVT